MLNQDWESETGSETIEAILNQQQKKYGKPLA